MCKAKVPTICATTTAQCSKFFKLLTVCFKVWSRKGKTRLVSPMRIQRTCLAAYRWWVNQERERGANGWQLLNYRVGPWVWDGLCLQRIHPHAWVTFFKSVTTNVKKLWIQEKHISTLKCDYGTFLLCSLKK